MVGRRRNISAPENSRSAEAGLTLVELLVVMSILALAASVVILNAPPSKPLARAAAEAFAARVSGALADAVINSAPYRLEVGGSEYVISSFRDGVWEPISRAAVESADNDLAFRVEAKSAAADNALALNGVANAARDDETEALLISIDPYGGGASFEAHFESHRGNWTVRVASDGAITMVRQ